MTATAATFDPRTTLARPDLADQALEGLVRAASYRVVTAMQCVVEAAAVRPSPRNDAPQDDQLIFGEAFDVLESADGWAWGRARRDGYVGWVQTRALSSPVMAPTHRVAAIRAHALAEPDVRSRPVLPLGLNALVTVEARRGRFVHLARAGWVFEGHLVALDGFDRDPAAVAERFLGAPYLWGGRESRGLDCSALVQQSLYACGRGCPRDADQQAELGEAVARPARGDLVVWAGHVGIMVDADRLVHADSHHMAVTVEPLAEADARRRAEGAEAAVFRRLAA